MTIHGFINQEYGKSAWVSLFVLLCAKLHLLLNFWQNKQGDVLSWFEEYSKNMLPKTQLDPLEGPLGALSKAKLKKIMIMLFPLGPLGGPPVSLIGILTANSYSTPQAGFRHDLSFPVDNFIKGVF